MKSIKRAINIFSLCVIVLGVLVIGLYLALMTSFVQTRLVDYVTRQLRARTGVEMSVGRVSFRPLETLVLEDVLLKDSQSDTLLFVKKLFARLDAVSILRRSFTVKELRLDKALFNYRMQRGGEDGDSVTNLDALLAAFARQEDTGETPSTTSWQVNLAGVELRDCRVTYVEEGYRPVEYGINWMDIDCREVYVILREIDLAGGGVRARVEGLRLQEKSGFGLDELTGRVALDDTHLLVTEGVISTGRSRLCLDTLAYEWIPGEGYWSDFVHKMPQRYLFSDAEVFLDDLSYFSSTLRGMNSLIAGSGDVYNTVANLSGRDLDLRVGDESRLRLSFRSEGLPSVPNTRFEIELLESHLSPAELRKIYLPWLEGEHLPIPEILDRYGAFDLSARFSGGVDHFEVTAASTTPGLEGTVSLNYRSDTTGYHYAGKARLDHLDYALLAGQTFLGTGTFEGDFNGAGGEKADFAMEGRAGQLPLFNTSLQQLQLSARMDGDRYIIHSLVDNDSIRADVTIEYTSRDTLTSLSIRGEADAREWNAWAPTLFAPGESAGLNFSGSWQERGTSSRADLLVTPLYYSNARGRVSIDTLAFTHAMAGERGYTALRSDVLDFQITGNYRDAQPGEWWDYLVYNYFPSYEHALKRAPPRDLNVACTATFKEFDALLDVIYPELSLPGQAGLSARYDGANGGIALEFSADSVAWGKMQLVRPKIRLAGDADTLDGVYTADRLDYARVGQVYNVRNTMKIRPDHVGNELTWSNWGRETYSGALSADLSLLRYQDRYITQVLIQPGVIIIGDSLWRMERSLIIKERDNFFVNNFEIRRDDQLFRLQGRVGESVHDTLFVRFENFELSQFNRLLFNDRVALFGKLNGQVKAQDLYKNRLVYADVELRQWGVARDTLGVLSARSRWDSREKLLRIDMDNRWEDRVPFSASGHYKPATDELQVKAVLSSINARQVTAYFPGLLGSGSGAISGILNVEGPADNPSLDGYLSFDRVAIPVEGINTTFRLNDRLEIKNSRLLFDRLRVQDATGNAIKTSGYYDIGKGLYDVNLKFNKFLILNATPSHDETVYGQLAITGGARVNNLAGGVPSIVADLRTDQNSRLFIPLGSTGIDDEYNFLHFVNTRSPETRRQAGGRRTDDERLDLDVALQITDALELQLIFDPTVGDILKTAGEGSFRLTLDKDNQVNIFGEYAVARGEYLFTMGNLINKRFVLQPGGSITWHGAPDNALVNITAIYPLRAALGDLVQDDVSGWSAQDYRAKVPVECTLQLTENLMNPTVNFGIEFPSLDTKVRSTLQGLLAGPDDINRQVFALLVMNRFYPMNNQEAMFRDAGYQAGVATASEMLSRQFSRWLSQFSSNLDIGVAYRPGDQENNNEFEFALSTQVWHNRVSISANGNVVEGARANGQAPVTGDFDVDVKLNTPGTLKLKAYSHTDTKITYNATETVQGVGVSYQENFDTFWELFRKYFGFLNKKKDRK
ncbi:MAG: translocation/assembly module TamB domain-containing protein [Odoribacteraceae bacterium]|jgi:hypothetical protein|nr:translocation/assembly module TamB domain-containing protein [Odoribacteraceae bacterium]